MTLGQLNFSSVKAICGESDQALIYGWEDCHYLKISKRLNNPFSSIKKTYDCSLGIQAKPDATWEGRHFEKIRDKQNCAAICKNAIVNVIFENFKRMKAGLPFIKVLFFLDFDGYQYGYAHLPHSVTSRGRENKLVTHSELRRSYKLCKELEGGDLDNIAKIAQSSIVFIKLVFNKLTSLTEFQALQPFWEHPDWQQLWQGRTATKNPRLSTSTWRTDLFQLLFQDKLLVPTPSVSNREIAKSYDMIEQFLNDESNIDYKEIKLIINNLDESYLIKIKNDSLKNIDDDINYIYNERYHKQILNKTPFLLINNSILYSSKELREALDNAKRLG